jgi:hypothetical protein
MGFPKVPSLKVRGDLYAPLEPFKFHYLQIKEYLIPTNLTFSYLEDVGFRGGERRERITDKKKPMQTKFSKSNKERRRFYEF